MCIPNGHPRDDLSWTDVDQSKIFWSIDWLIGCVALHCGAVRCALRGACGNVQRRNCLALCVLPRVTYAEHVILWCILGHFAPKKMTMQYNISLWRCVFAAKRKAFDVIDRKLTNVYRRTNPSPTKKKPRLPSWCKWALTYIITTLTRADEEEFDETAPISDASEFLSFFGRRRQRSLPVLSSFLNVHSSNVWQWRFLHAKSGGNVGRGQRKSGGGQNLRRIF